MQPVSYKQISTRGVSLVEVAIGVTILSVVAIMVLLTLSLFVQAREALLNKTQSLYLAESGLETMRFIRDEDWNTLGTSLSLDTTYYLEVSTSTVTTTTTPEVIDGRFTRQFQLHGVYRDTSSADIVASTTGSNYLDSGSVEVEMMVAYETGTTTLHSLLGNIFDI